MEFLKEYLGEELYKQVAEKLAKTDKVKLANLADGGYVAKGKFDAETDKVKTLKDDLEKRDADLAELTKSAGQSETLKADLEKLQSEYSEKSNAYEKSLLNADIKLAIIEYGGRDPISVMAHLDTSQVQKVEGKLTGLTEQLDTVKESRDYLFGDQKPNFQSNPPNPQTQEGTSDYQTRLNEARKKGDNVLAIKIKQEAFEKGELLI